MSTLLLCVGLARVEQVAGGMKRFAGERGGSELLQ
jgi:hypothetical protein